jgi:6-phospho-beta-glucosidase
VFAQMTVRRRTLFYIDVMARGSYPTWQADYFKNHGVELKTESGDENILKNGTIDYVSFSMYRSTTCTPDSELKMNVLAFDPNPYLTANPWGWTIIWACVMY